uniref:Uncharacterized protein n=1 Tax=Rhizophora mucronata TaxID=61149 RepID=A0A2P2PPC8_RHIMU
MHVLATVKTQGLRARTKLNHNLTAKTSLQQRPMVKR